MKTESKNNFIVGIVIAAFFLIIAGSVAWGIRSAVESAPTDPINLKTAVQNSSGASASANIKNADYTLTDNAENGIDVQLASKTPFKMNFPTALDKPVTIYLSDNRTIEISQKDGADFAVLPKEQIVKTAENAKLLALIQEDPALATYQSTAGNLAFYNYQKIAGEQKQALFKNWILFNTPASESTQTQSYEIKNANVNIDSNGDAQVFFDDGRATSNKSSDFTIPRPYFLDKDGFKTDLNWQFNQASHTLSVLISAQANQYPIALDPSVLTDTVIATFSGKAIEMSIPLVCGTNTISDVDGNTYNTVAIGSQCWTKENMMTSKYPDGSSITRGPTGATWNGVDNGYYAYPPNIGNTAEESLANIQSGKLGFAYQWSAAMHGSTTAGAQGICPAGWHVPTHDEYTTMERAICTSATCATDFPFDTVTTGWRGTNEGSKLSTETSGGTNSSGFTAHLAGYRNTNGSFYTRSSSAYFWTSVQSGGNAWYRYLYSGYATVSRSTYSKAYAWSVRCLKN